MRVIKPGSSILVWAALLLLKWTWVTAPTAAAELNVRWTNNMLSVSGPNLPGGKLDVWYLEAFCRHGSTKQDWALSTIPHTTQLISTDPKQSLIRLRSQVQPAVEVLHEIRAGIDEVDFLLTFKNNGAEFADVQWFQPCIRVDRFTGRTQSNYVSRCFIFTENGLTTLDKARRREEAIYHGGQIYVPSGIDLNDVNPRPISPDVPVNGLIGCFSADNQSLMATAWDQTQELFQGVIVCLHSDPHVGGLQPGESKKLHGKLYLMKNDPGALLAHYQKDFPVSDSSIPAPVQQAFARLRPSALKADVKFLASDLLEGRGPGTRGDALAMEYIAAQFAGAGLEPGGDDGTYFQKIALLGLTLDATRSSFGFSKEGAAPVGPLKYLEQFVAGNPSQTETAVVDSEVVFVGHGVVAPEYQWDDYKGVDVRGKTLLMLVDDPPANAKEPDLFKGDTRTYYGRWTYKYEIGTAKGAQAVLLVHTDKAAGYPWSVVRNSWGGESDSVRLPAGESALRCAGWVTEKAAAELCAAAGNDLDTLTKAAAARDFRPVSLGYRLKSTCAYKTRSFDTANVIAKLPGADPALRSEAILYTAHHDHLGIGEPDQKGDRIYNGAIDNATGCALLLELARVWASTSPAPKRSILFNAVAAEEQGLLGSEYFGLHATVPTGRIALAINVDAIPQLGRVRDVTMLGVERTTFLPTAQKIARSLQLTIVPDPEPEQGHYYRSDHFSLAKVGIPAFSIDPGQDVIGKPPGWGKAQSDDYREHRYHQPRDAFDPNWDWSEGVQMAQLGYWLGWEAANADTMPIWVPGDEFRAARDKSLRGTGK